MTASPPRRRGLRRTVIVLVSLLVLLLVVDRGGNLVAENLAADKLKSSQRLPNRPDVGISGFPFLTQLASGRYDEVTVDATGVPIGSGGAGLTLSSVRVVLSNMTVSGNFTRVHVDRASALATVNYADLSRTLGVQVSYADNGTIRASKQIMVLGQTITPTVTARARLVDGALQLAATQASGLGPLAGELTQVAAQVFGSNVPLQGIPFQVRVSDASFAGDGLQIRLVGSNLTYQG